MFTTTVLFALLALGVADHEEFLANSKMNFCSKEFHQDATDELVWALDVQGSDNCQFNCFVGTERMTVARHAPNLTPCSEGVCLNGTCVDESDLRACLDKLEPQQTLAAFKTEGCAITCLDEHYNAMNAIRGDYNYCKLPETQDGDEFTSEYGYCLDGTCHQFEMPEPYSGEDGQSGENSQGQSGEDSQTLYDSTEE